ncbi:MAG: hypothetical protein H6584_07350 [Flavobacteriales bacterium]|nr:hypothetical protein [Flavobacteriales bacterium]
MSPEIELKTKINWFEENYPVEEWKIYGVDLWPLIRIKVYLTVLAGLSAKGNENKKSSIAKFGHTYIYRFLRYVYALIAFGRFYVRLPRKSLLFFSVGSIRLNHQGKAFHKLFDSMIDYHNLQDKVFFFEFEKIHKNIYNKKNVYLLNEYIKEFKIVKNLFSKKHCQKLSLEKYDLFLEELNNDNLFEEVKVFFEIDNLKIWVDKLLTNSTFFEIVYKKIKPEKIIYSNFYSWDDIISSLLAANNLNIPTYDIQHGPISNIHLVFSSWEKVPVKGYNTMVKEFWTWDERSNESIMKWAAKTSTVTAKIIGNTYLSYAMSNYQLNTSQERNKNHILYTLQPIYTIERMVHSKIIELIKSNNFIWVFRLHPRNTFRKNELSEYIEKAGISNKVRVEEYFENSLLESLTNSVLHVTNYSGTTIEAKLMGVPTILIDDFAVSVYHDDYGDDDEILFLDVEKEDFVSKFMNFMNSYNFENKHLKKMEVYNPMSN